MIKTFVSLSIVILCSIGVMAQNSNSSTKAPERHRSTTNSNSSKTTSTDVQKPATTTSAPKQVPKKPVVTQTPAAGSEAVVAAFNSLLDGIRHADLEEVTSVYWNSPRLSLFNYNGSVTKGWEQMRKNRESSYPEIKDVKLDVRDLSVSMLGRDGAIVTCLWTQSQTYKGTPETAGGRMTLVFKRVGTTWKAIHLHSSTDNPNPATVPASEQMPKTTSATPKP
jgi:ketosteroid isomerase-like protein